MLSPRHLLPFVALLLLASAELGAQTRRALVIGINRYEAVPASSRAAAAQRGTITDLSGAVNDAMAVRDMLQARFGFDPANVSTLTDQQATRAGIIAGIERLAAESERGDVVVFFYAGHGSQRKNSLSPEPSKLDQTLVPADANAGVFDIRDKELARLFNQVVDKGAELVLIFDSCHSGSVARGGIAPQGAKVRERWAAVDPRDAADAGVEQPPEERRDGAVVISAAQDYQLAAERVDDSGHSSGIFTTALIAALQGAPPSEPVQEVFKRIKARMQMDGRLQEPVLAGPPEKLRRPLFGGASARAGALSAAVLRVSANGTVELQGGPALGIRPGAELRKAGATAADSAVRLRVDTVVGVSRVRGTVIAGSRDRVAAGDLFELEKWVAAPNTGVTVALAGAGPDANTLATLANEIGNLRGASGIQWVDDPSLVPADTVPMYTMRWSGAGWELKPQTGAPIALPRTPTSAQVRSALASASGGRPVRFFLSLPPTRSMLSVMRRDVGPQSAVQVTDDPAGATYVLVGRAGGEGIQYSLIQPTASLETSRLSSLPPRTEWVDVAGADSMAAARLVEHAYTLARVRSWLTLESPPSDPRAFPYRLAFKRLSDGAMLTEGPFRNGEQFEVVLVADPAQVTPMLERRRVYIFAIDNKGNGALLYPSSNVENLVPFGVVDGSWPAEIPLGPRSRFRIQPPFGVDTFVMVASDEPIDPSAFRWDGVDRSAGFRGSSLSKLLAGASGRTRAVGQDVPMSWSIQRVPILSEPGN